MSTESPSTAHKLQVEHMYATQGAADAEGAAEAYFAAQEQTATYAEPQEEQ